MIELALNQFDDFSILQNITGENNRIFFSIIFPTQFALSTFINQIRCCHGDMKIRTKKGIIRFTMRYKGEGKLPYHIYQDRENLLKIEGNGFILKNAKW